MSTAGRAFAEPPPETGLASCWCFRPAVPWSQVSSVLTSHLRRGYICLMTSAHSHPQSKPRPMHGVDATTMAVSRVIIILNLTVLGSMPPIGNPSQIQLGAKPENGVGAKQPGQVINHSCRFAAIALG